MIDAKRIMQALLAVLLYIAVTEFAGKVEGRLFPVVTDVTVEWSDFSEVRSSVSGSFRLVRPGCDFEDVVWRLDRDRSPRVPIEFLEGTKERESGLQYYGPWLVQLTAAQRTQSSAVALHRCPFRPWVTETVFYRPLP